MKKALLIAVVAVFAGCTAKLLTPAQTDVDRMQTKYPGYTLSELNAGKMLYEQHCGNCHGLKKPTAFSEQKWQEIVPDMAKKVNKKGPVLAAAGEEQILKYVVTMSAAKK